jgi:putative endonuclease
MNLLWWKKKDENHPEPAHLRAGKWGEAQAERFLKAKGYRILTRRLRIGKRDELDLVARERDALVFIEVKTRKGELFGAPASAVKRDKREALSRAAIHYLKKLRYPKVNFRFDVVEVIGEPDDNEEPVIRHIPNAFQLDRRYRVP